MATVIKPKRSETGSSVPSTSNLAVGEMAVNTADQKIYVRDSSDNIVIVGAGTASASELACDDLTAGDAAVTISTSSGNITIDAAANDSDIILKGTDGGADTTFLTIDGSAAGAATFNNKIVATELDISGNISSTRTDTNTNLTLTTTEDSASAGPVIDLKRNSGSPADSDYLGQIKFQGENDADQEVLYAKITGKIGDASDGTEDGIIEFACKENGSNVINMRLTNDHLNLLNSTDLDVDGTVTATGTSVFASLDISGDIDVDGTTNLDVVDIDGAVDMATTLGVTGVVTANAGVVIDNITIDGTEIDLSSGDLTLDVAGDIILDAGGDEVIFKDGSTNVGHVSLDSDNLTIKTLVGDKDFIIKGVDDSSEITALTLDMSAAGAATFNNDVTAFSDVRLKENIETIPDALNKVCQIRGVTFDRKDTDGPRQMGVIAQEVEEVAPEVIREDSSDDKIKSVAYGNIVALLIESVKELNEKVEKLEKTIINTKKINR